MSNKSEEQIPSGTALFVALRRTLAYKKHQNDKFGADYLAEYFLPAHYRFFIRFEKIRQNTREKLDAFMPGMNEYIVARTAYFDGLFNAALKDKIPQIVLLGAGYDSRAYRFEKNNLNTVVYELDTAPTQDRKKKCLKSARIRIPGFLKYVPINFMEESIGEVLQKAGYSDRKKLSSFGKGLPFTWIRSQLMRHWNSSAIRAMEIVRSLLTTQSRLLKRMSMIIMAQTIS